MILVILSVTVLVCLFISIVNFFYQKEKYRYSSDEEIKRLPLFESPSTWRICITVSALILAGTIVICAASVMGGFSNIGKQQDIIDQYQNDSLYQDIENEQTD